MSDSGKKAPHSNVQILLFIGSLCLVCALVLSVVSTSLENRQEMAKEFDQSKQMLIAAKVLNHAGYFEILQSDGTLQRARFDPSNKLLIADSSARKATDPEIKEVAAMRIRPLLTDSAGTTYTLEEKNLSLTHYLAENKKTGVANLPFKLFYALLPNKENAGSMTAAEINKELNNASAFVIPVSGFGLWAPIYGYIAISPNGDTVIGTTWYEHGETPGLGANIAEAWWQKQFFDKLIFQESAGGKTDFKTAEMGIIVVKGKVKDVYGNLPKAKSAVDGMSGATLTGDGVTAAYRNSLTPYRNFLIKLHSQEKP